MVASSSFLRPTVLLISALALCASGCRPDDDPPGDDDESTGGTGYLCENGISAGDFSSGNSVPVEACWETIADAEFDPSLMSSIRVGGPLDDDNFANRGDIELHYVLETNRIVVQMKAFTFATSEETALADFAKLIPWLYTASSVAPPFDLSLDDACVIDGQWQDSCSVRVWYDGLAQKLRSGTDIRVFVPKGWEGEAQLVTEDNVQELEDYPARGTIRVIDVPGTADLILDGGVVELRLDRDTEPVPACSAQENLACAEVGWDQSDESCLGCVDFGRTHVGSRGGTAADIVVDAPADLWIVATLENQEQGLTTQSDPTCFVDLACEDFGGCEWVDNDPLKPWDRRAFLNQPDNALQGLGYNIQLSSSGCFSTAFAESPEDFGDPQMAPRGHIELCSGCLGDLESPGTSARQTWPLSAAARRRPASSWVASPESSAG